MLSVSHQILKACHICFQVWYTAANAEEPVLRPEKAKVKHYIMLVGHVSVMDVNFVIQSIHGQMFWSRLYYQI